VSSAMCYFNSKMVRLRGQTAKGHHPNEGISIPKWCDWERTILTNCVIF